MTFLSLAGRLYGVANNKAWGHSIDSAHIISISTALQQRAIVREPVQAACRARLFHLATVVLVVWGTAAYCQPVADRLVSDKASLLLFGLTVLAHLLLAPPPVILVAWVLGPPVLH